MIDVLQLLLAPLIAALLRRTDPRLVLAAGLLAIGIACVMVTPITREWATNDFLPSQVLQAFGQSAALIALILFAVRHLNPADALTFGALLQAVRLMGGELGNAFMQTYVPGTRAGHIQPDRHARAERDREINRSAGGLY